MIEGKEQIKDDLIVMNIEDEQEITKKYVTAKYRKLVKLKHPDKAGGDKSDFQILQQAYKNIIAFIEKNEHHKEKDDFETDFFTKHNIVKECTNSFVIYLQDSFVIKWRQVLEKTP